MPISDPNQPLSRVKVESLRDSHLFSSYFGLPLAGLPGFIEGTFDVIALSAAAGVSYGYATEDFSGVRPEVAATAGVLGVIWGCYRGYVAYGEEKAALTREMQIIQAWLNLDTALNDVTTDKILAQYEGLLIDSPGDDSENKRLALRLAAQSIIQETLESTLSLQPSLQQQPSSIFTYKAIDLFDFCIKQFRNAFGLASIIASYFYRVKEERNIDSTGLIYIAIGVVIQLIPRIIKYFTIDRPRANLIQKLNADMAEKEAKIKSIEKRMEEAARNIFPDLPENSEHLLKLKILADTSTPVSATDEIIHTDIQENLTSILHALWESNKAQRILGQSLAATNGFFDGALHVLAITSIAVFVCAALALPPLGIPLMIGIGIAATCFGAYYAERARRKEIEAENIEKIELEKTLAVAQNLEKLCREELTCEENQVTTNIKTSAQTEYENEIRKYNQSIQEAQKTLTKLKHFYKKTGNISLDQMVADKSSKEAPLPIGMPSNDALAGLPQPPLARTARDGFGVMEIALSALLVTGYIVSSAAVLATSVAC
ncbi:MAG: hypothetical protein ACHP9Y_06270, partial [Gammaproteobacteria bacterium]